MINELVWHVFEYSICLIEVFFLYIFLNEMMEKKQDIPRYVMYIGIVVVSSIVSGLTWISMFSMIKTVACYILYIMFVIIFYEGKNRIKLFWATIYFIVLSLIDVVSLYLISYIIKQDIITIGLTINWYRIIYCIFAKLILFILIKLFIKTTRKSLEYVPAKFWRMIIGIFVVSLISMITILEVGIRIKADEIVGLFLVIVSVGILVLTITIYQIFQYICNYFERENQYVIIEYQNQMMIEATLERDETHKEIRKIWHDFNNHISCIDMLLQMDNIKRAREYISQMKLNSENVTFEIKTGNEIADAVINQKYMKAKKHQIEFSVQGFLGEDIGINAVDLCALMSNGIDNAIEANLKIEDESKRNIQIYMKPYKDYLLIEIINTVKEEIQQKEILETTKKDKNKHGFGMLNMKKIVEKYKGYLRYNCENNHFNLSIMLKIIGD